MPHSTLSRCRDKFSPRASKCVLLGYPSGYKGYKVLDIEYMQEIITRHVIFHEDTFPFSHLSPSVFPSPSTSDPHSSSSPDNSSSSHSHLTPANPSSPAPNDQNEQSPTTRAGRTIKTPAHLTDYLCNSVSSLSLYPISSYFSLSKLSPVYLKFIVLMTAILEPTSHSQASKYPEWQQAMHEELAALIRNNTWLITTISPGKIPIDCKWV